MSSPAADLAQRLARDAEAVCRHYLPNGRRAGRYWLVGDVAGTPGRSLYVRLSGPAAGAGAGSAGKWTDAHTGEHGDLLDLIAANRRLTCLRDTLDEARDFLRLPRPEVQPERQPVPVGSPAAARRLWAMGKPLPGTIAEAYLRQRGITAPLIGRAAALSSALLLSRRRRSQLADLAGTPRCRDRCRRRDHRRPPHLARSGWRQGPGRDPAAGDGVVARQRRAVRPGRRYRRHRRRARNRSCRSAACSRHCRWSRRCRPHISARSIRLPDCADSTLPPTATRLVILPRRG